jgi:predicted nucleotidyltransferase
MIETERETTLVAARDALLAAMPDLWAIYVYGSFARGEEWPDSDIDLAVLPRPEEDIPDLLELMGKLAELTGREVDLVNLRKVGDVLRREVLSAGRVLHVSDANAVLSWEASAMSRYARHREEIRDILEDFKRTGIGYAR